MPTRNFYDRCQMYYVGAFLANRWRVRQRELHKRSFLLLVSSSDAASWLPSTAYTFVPTNRWTYTQRRRPATFSVNAITRFARSEPVVVHFIQKLAETCTSE